MHTKNYIILSTSVVLVLLGVLIEDRGLAMHLTDDGVAIYPVSSGSDDGGILKFGLSSFVITCMYALLSIVTKGTAHRLLLVYCLNSLFYLFLLFLVMLDSDIVYAASIGDWLPLAANVVWFTSFILYGVISLIEMLNVAATK